MFRIQRSWCSGGNRLRTALLGNSRLMWTPKDHWFSSWLSMWKCFITLCLNATRRNKRQDDKGDDLVTTCLHLLLVLYGLMRAPPFLKTSANTSQIVSSELSDNFKLYLRVAFIYGAFEWCCVYRVYKKRPPLFVFTTS